MAAVNIKILRESPKFERAGLYPCKVLAINLGSDPENPYGRYATAVRVYPKEGKPFVISDSIRLFKSVNQVMRDFADRLLIFE